MNENVETLLTNLIAERHKDITRLKKELAKQQTKQERDYITRHLKYKLDDQDFAQEVVDILHDYDFICLFTE